MVAFNVQWVYLLKSMDRISSEKMSMSGFDHDLFDFKKKEVNTLTEKITFKQFPLRQEILCALNKKKFDNPSPVQVQVMNETNIMNEDLIVQAKTGSGKTLAFGIPLLNTFEKIPTQPAVLILSPTRELAIQTANELKWLGSEMDIKIATLVGGMDIVNQRRELLNGPALVVGTPGRVLDHIRRGNYRTEEIQTIVLDEGDHMLDLGFREELEAIFESHENVDRIWLFSATMPKQVRELSKNYLTHPKWISLDQDLTAHQDIKHRVYLIPFHHRLESLVNVLLWEGPEKALIFCSTRQETIECAAFLTEAGFSANALHGEMTQRERNSSLNSFRTGITTCLVATDVAARGLDIDMVSHVIQLGLPGDLNNYVHRSGRTGRAGHLGLSIVLLSNREASHFRNMFSRSSLKVEWKPLPDQGDIQLKNQQRIEQKLTDRNVTVEPHIQKWSEKLVAEEDPVDLVAKLLQWNSKGNNLGYSLKLFLDEDKQIERERKSRFLQERKNHQRKNLEKKSHSTFAKGGTIRLSTGTTNGWEVGKLLGTLCRILGTSRQEIGNIRLREDYANVELSQKALQLFQEKKPKFVEEYLINHMSSSKRPTPNRSSIISN
jgi:ATP-dependent RNA helicase DeaD